MHLCQTGGCDDRTIKWRDARKVKPDDDETVVIRVENGDEPVWLGYHSGDEGWFYVEGSMPEAGSVTHWAPMPKGPRGKR
jgi:hypothetical protein